MAVVCRQCGRHNPDGVHFCANPDCGAFLGWEEDRVPAATASRAGPQTAAAAVTLSATELTVEPGETVSTTATVFNGGSQVEQFAMSVLGPLAQWATVEPPRPQIYPAGRAECTVHLTPPREVSTPAGRAWFTVRATSTLHPGLVADAGGTVDVGAFHDVNAVLVPQETSARRRSEHRVEITNAGNVVEAVQVQAADPAAKMTFGVPVGELALPPGQHRVALPVRAPLRWLGRPVKAPFTVTVTPRPPARPIRLDGLREIVPLIAGWVPKVAVAVLGVGLVAALLFIPGSPLAPKKNPVDQTVAPQVDGGSAPASPGVPPAGPSPPGPAASPPSAPAASSGASASPATPPAQIVVVDASGAKARGVKGSSVVRRGTGRFEVGFGSSVRNCAYVATIGDPAGGPVAAGLVATGNGRRSSTVAVETRNLEGALADLPFHLHALCGKRGQWVVGSSTGSQVRGNGVASFNRSAPGEYEVTFTAATGECAYLATVGDAGRDEPSAGRVFTSGGAGGPNGVAVVTRTSAGAAADLPFHLQLVCGDTARWLVADETGRQRRGTAVSAVRAGPGTWEATFAGDVAACAYLATIGQPGEEPPAAAGLVHTARGTGGARSVRVTTVNDAGVATDLPYHLVAAC